jgi:hypothetical protein
MNCEIKTAEQIAAMAESKYPDNTEKQRKHIRNLFRYMDDSELWPINGRFNVTERAIKHANKVERESDIMSPLEYALFIEMETSNIVNDPRQL